MYISFVYEPVSLAVASRMKAAMARSHKPKKQINNCVILPANACMVAVSIEQRNHSWYFRTNVASDLLIQVGKDVFHLHKLPMVSGSKYINRLVFNRSSGSTNTDIKIENFPGGSKTFELVVKFCYGWEVNVAASNIAPLYCAAHFLEMSDDLQKDNLISKAEIFLSFIILSSWNDTFQILKSIESISSWARELRILKRCSEAIAWKVCADIESSIFIPSNSVQTWWFEDVSVLRVDQFIEVIASFKRKSMRPDLVGSCIAYWTTNWLSRAKIGLDNLEKDLSVKVERVTIESLIRVLPEEEKSVSCVFLVQLLKLGLGLKIDSKLIGKLERRAALMLESCRAKDLLIEHYIPSEMVSDVSIVAKVVQAYVSLVPSSPASSRIFNVGRLVDEYLMLVARNKNLPAKDYQLLVKALPQNARYCDDNLYRAIDMYLKAHPSLTEEERSGICRAMEYHKLSQEARQHATKNERLPMNIRTRFILLEQVNITRTLTATGSNYQRTKSQAILKVSKGLERGWINSQKDIKLMKQDVEAMKVQLSKLHSCRVELQRQAKKCVV